MVSSLRWTDKTELKMNLDGGLFVCGSFCEGASDREAAKSRSSSSRVGVKRIILYISEAGGKMGSFQWQLHDLVDVHGVEKQV